MDYRPSPIPINVLTVLKLLRWILFNFRFCEECDGLHGATLRTSLQTKPPVLVIHLKRFLQRTIPNSAVFLSKDWTAVEIDR